MTRKNWFIAIGLFFVVVFITKGLATSVQRSGANTVNVPTKWLDNGDYKTEVIPGNKMHNAMLPFDEVGRIKVLAIAVSGDPSNQPCKGVYAFYAGQEHKSHEAFWNVKCSDGSTYMVSFDASDVIDTRYVRVISCEALAALNAGPCFKRSPN